MRVRIKHDLSLLVQEENISRTFRRGLICHINPQPGFFPGSQT